MHSQCHSATTHLALETPPLAKVKRWTSPDLVAGAQLFSIYKLDYSRHLALPALDGWLISLGVMSSGLLMLLYAPEFLC